MPMKVVEVDGLRTLVTDRCPFSVQECKYGGWLWVCDGTRDRDEIIDMIAVLEHWLDTGRLPSTPDLI